MAYINKENNVLNVNDKDFFNHGGVLLMRFPFLSLEEKWDKKCKSNMFVLWWKLHQLSSTWKKHNIIFSSWGCSTIFHKNAASILYLMLGSTFWLITFFTWGGRGEGVHVRNSTTFIEGFLSFLSWSYVLCWFVDSRTGHLINQYNK